MSTTYPGLILVEVVDALGSWQGWQAR